MRIAAHHTWKDSDFVPACDWPEQAYVQWGGKGFVVSGSESYETAFFEAFPGDAAGGFIRGQGTTIAEAELACFGKYRRQVECSHRWGRKDYTNGGAICHVCGAFKTVFRPIVELGAHRRPLSRMEAMMSDVDGLLAKSDPDMARLMQIRGRLFGVE